MPVAPSFKDYQQLTDEPFIKDGKYYIKVRNPKTGNERTVRWYSDSEYAKQYGKKQEKSDDNGYFKGLKQARGFANGPILVIRRNRPQDEEWLRQSIARYAVGIGWHFVSTDNFPEDAPAHFKYLLLSWDEFRNGDDFHKKSPSELSDILDKKAKNKEWFNIT